MNLPQLVAPQSEEALGEIPDHDDRVARLMVVARAGIGDAQVERRGDKVEQRDHQDRGFGRGVYAGIDERQIDGEQ